MTTDNFCFYLPNRLIQTSQTGGQQYSDTSPLSIPCPGSLPFALPLPTGCSLLPGFDTQMLLDKMSLDQMPLKQVPLYQMLLDQMLLEQLSLPQMSLD